MPDLHTLLYECFVNVLFMYYKRFCGLVESMVEWIERYKLEQRRIMEEQAKQAKVDSENSLQDSTALIKKIMTAQPK